MLLGIGIGILIGVFFTLGARIERTISDDKIEQRARELGMKYKEEMKVLEKGE